MVVEFRTQELRGALTESHIVGVLRKRDAIAREPCGFADAGVGSGDAEAGNDGVAGAGDNAEEHRIGMRHYAPGCDLLHRRGGNVAEEEVGDIAFKDNDLAVAGQDAGEHADRALQHSDHGKHGRDTEGDARNTDRRPDAMAAQIGHDQLEKDHERAPTGIAQAFPVTRTSSS